MSAITCKMQMEPCIRQFPLNPPLLSHSPFPHLYSAFCWGSATCIFRCSNMEDEGTRTRKLKFAPFDITGSLFHGKSWKKWDFIPYGGGLYAHLHGACPIQHNLYHSSTSKTLTNSPPMWPFVTCRLDRPLTTHLLICSHFHLSNHNFIKRDSLSLNKMPKLEVPSPKEDWVKSQHTPASSLPHNHLFNR